MFAAGLLGPDDVLTRAELAAKEAKRQGGGRVIVFSDALKARLDEAVVFEQALRDAIPAQLLLHFQPQVDVTGRPFGAEVLLRWQHPQWGMVSPARFIPVAERTGLIVPIGRWVLMSACQQIQAWAEDPVLGQLVLAVNISAHEFAAPDIVQTVQDTLAQTGANPRRLKIELTESALVQDLEDVVSKMVQIRALGVGFSLDDFGTGFSSLNYLSRLPLDQLKIDQSFVRQLSDPSRNTAVVRSIIALGQGLGLSVIAEGVETAEQRSWLLQWGCAQFQGYWHGRPMPVAAFEQAVRAQSEGVPESVKQASGAVHATLIG